MDLHLPRLTHLHDARRLSHVRGVSVWTCPRGAILKPRDLPKGVLAIITLTHEHKTHSSDTGWPRLITIHCLPGEDRAGCISLVKKMLTQFFWQFCEKCWENSPHSENSGPADRMGWRNVDRGPPKVGRRPYSLHQFYLRQHDALAHKGADMLQSNSHHPRDRYAPLTSRSFAANQPTSQVVWGGRTAKD